MNLLEVKRRAANLAGWNSSPTAWRRPHLWPYFEHLPATCDTQLRVCGSNSLHDAHNCMGRQHHKGGDYQPLHGICCVTAQACIQGDPAPLLRTRWVVIWVAVPEMDAHTKLVVFHAAAPNLRHSCR